MKAALANDPDVQVARAKMLLAEAELAKAKQGVVLKVMTLQATIKEHRIAIDRRRGAAGVVRAIGQEGKAPQSSMLDERAKVEAAKAALVRAETELKLLTGGGKEMGMEAGGGATDVAIKHGTLWLSRQALLDPPPDADSSSNTVSLSSLAALYLSGTKTPVGAIPDRIRGCPRQDCEARPEGREDHIREGDGGIQEGSRARRAGTRLG